MSNSIAESALRVATPIVRRRPVVAVLGLVTVAALWFVADAYQRYHRVRAVQAAITSVGGEVTLPLPVWEFAWQRWWVEQSVVNWTSVFLDKPTIDGAWLRAHDDLRGLEIDVLGIGNTSLSSGDVARLVAAHPIRQFTGWTVPNMDVVAAALGRSPTVTLVFLSGSDLSDTGLRQLPLERLHCLNVPETNVTPAGLQELRRCGELQQITLDGRQFNGEVSGVLAKLPRLLQINLQGENVTDEHLDRLRGDQLAFVYLRQTSATSEGIAALRRALPECEIHVEPPG